MPKFLADMCVWVIGCFSKHDVTDIVAARAWKKALERQEGSLSSIENWRGKGTNLAVKGRCF